VVTAPARLTTIESVARRCFSDFPNGRPPSLRFPLLRSRKPSTIRVDLPGRSEVDIRVGGNSLARSDPEYPAAFLANEILGGRGQLSRLFQRIRERSGLVYHAASQLEAMRYGGHWTVAAGTGPHHAAQVARMLSTELDRLETHSVSASELAEVRESAIGEIPLALESTADAHELAVEVAYHRLPEDYLVQWPTLLREVRPRDVREAAEHAMDRRHAVTVLAGPLGPR
jgi:zinc protease